MFTNIIKFRDLGANDIFLSYSIKQKYQNKLKALLLEYDSDLGLFGGYIKQNGKNR